MIKSIISKDMAPNAVLDMMAAMEKLTGKRIQAIKTDHGREYRSTYFENELLRRSIMIIENAPYHSKTNAVTEHVHRTLLTMGKTVLICSKLTKIYWPEAFCHAAFTKNRIPHAALNGKIPLEIFQPETDTINERKRFRTFGE
jgi:transposase InsO family protein